MLRSLTKTISQRELRNRSGEVMRAPERGESFVVTRNGVPVGEIRRYQKRRFVDSRTAAAAAGQLPAIDRERFRADVDRHIDDEFVPRS